jgi:putative hemolysin
MIVERTWGLIVVIAAVSVAACDGGRSPTGEEDERGSVGPGSPAAIYCEKIGYRTEGELCMFPDGTSCEQWSFYRATCGQKHSFCVRKGGTIVSEQADAGGFTTVTAVCTVNGTKCDEENFYRSGACP